jgi:hypothetical protein
MKKLIRLIAPFSLGDELETSSVFEGSECGEPADVDTISLSSISKKVLPRREDVLHKEGGKDGQETRYVL